MTDPTAPLSDILLSDYAAMQAENARLTLNNTQLMLVNMRLRMALRSIARQKKTTESEDLECASFEDGYDMCIDTARAALKEGEE